jgi:hypothetical protein
MQQAIFFSDAGIDRAAELRVDIKRLSGIFNSPEALVSFYLPSELCLPNSSCTRLKVYINQSKASL